MNNVLLKTENKNIKLISTNLEVGINCIIRGKVEEDGDITIPARIFNDYVSLLPNDRVNIETKGDEAQINCNNFATKIKGNPSSDFPLIPLVDRDKSYSCKISINDFKKAIQQVIFALAPNESRTELSGIFISSRDGILTLAATDSFRLAEKRIKIISEANKEENGISTIIPYRTLNEVARILSNLQKDDEIEDEKAYLSIHITENQILFSCKNIELISRIIVAKYPDYKQIIPQEFKTKVILNTKTLINSVKAASLFTKVGIYDISIAVNPEQNKIKIASLNSQLGENQSEIETSIEGAPEELILNYRYLLDGLQNINAEKILLKIADKIKPCLIAPLSDEGKEIPDYIYLIMPIRQ